MKLYYFIFGYLNVLISGEERAEAVTALLRRGLTGKISENGILRVPFFKRKRYENALKNISHTTVRSGGLPVILLNNKRRYGIISGLILLAAIYVLTSFFVWDIRITGNEKISDTIILDELSDVGFETGNTWRSLSLGEVEGRLLEVSENIGWININRRGNVAYVTVKEKAIYKPSEEKAAFSNVVASCDAVIEEITVRSGVACVKVGDTVKAGELLISGIIPNELGGGFVGADGDVFGRVAKDITVEIERNETVMAYGEEKLYKASIKIFKLPINIFKKYGKLDNSCAIIEDVKECTLFGKYRIPIVLERLYVTEKTEVQKNYTDAELMSIASLRLAELRFIRLAEAELMKIRTDGEFTERGYRMTSYVTVLENIGETRSFTDE